MKHLSGNNTWYLHCQKRHRKRSEKVRGEAANEEGKCSRLAKRTSWSVQFSSVAQSCPTLCDPMNRSMPGLPVHHHLPKFTQTHVHRVSDAIQHDQFFIKNLKKKTKKNLPQFPRLACSLHVVDFFSQEKDVNWIQTCSGPCLYHRHLYLRWVPGMRLHRTQRVKRTTFDANTFSFFLPHPRGYSRIFESFSWDLARFEFVSKSCCFLTLWSLTSYLNFLSLCFHICQTAC